MGAEMRFRVHCISNFVTHDATHNSTSMHVLGRTYATVRDLQVVEGTR
jgi:hypothetical protein